MQRLLSFKAVGSVRCLGQVAVIDPTAIALAQWPLMDVQLTLPKPMRVEATRTAAVRFGEWEHPTHSCPWI